MIIILFGCLRREVPQGGIIVNMMTGSVSSAKIITTPFALSVSISLPRQPLPCPNQGVQRLSHPLATRTCPTPTISITAVRSDIDEGRPFPKLLAIDGEQ